MEQTKQTAILVVDGDDSIRLLLESVLAAAGYAVHSNASGEEALSAIAEHRPDLVLLDVTLPDMDGLEVMRRMKRDLHSCGIPIILMAALNDRDLRLQGLSAGAAEFLFKPVDHAELQVRIKNLLASKEYSDLLSSYNRVLEGQIEARTLELQESEARYRRITEEITDYLYTVRIENGRAVETIQNPVCVTATGYTAEEFLADPYLWIQMVAPEDRDLVMAHVRKILEGNDVPPIEHRIIRKNGEMRWISDTTILFKDAAGKLLSYVGVIKDVTERKLVELRLLESEEKFRRITESVQDAIIMMGADRRISFWNAMAERIFGYAAEEALGREMHELIVPEPARGMFMQAFPGFQASGKGAVIGKMLEVNALRKGGEAFPVELSVAATQLNGQWHAIGIVRDITARKKSEAETQHANRALATLGAVSRTLVHATDEDELLQALCQAIVEQNGYRLAWVGYAQHNEGKHIKIMARAGHDDGYVDSLQLTWAECERGMGPSGRAMRSGETQFCQDMASDSLFQPWRDAALERGYASCITLPLSRRNGNVFGILSVYAAEVNAFSSAEVELLEEMAADLAFGVRSLHTRHEHALAQEKIKQQLLKLQNNLEDTVRAIASMLEMRDPYTAGHQVKVADLAAAIARQMGLPDEQIRGIYMAGMVHDLGKIQVPSEILSKPGKISEAEFSLIKGHAQAGYDILKGIDFPWPIAQMVLQHHERMNGSGYPQGLAGEAILIEARILGVADVVEAMSSHRPYRPGLGIEVALEEIIRQRGTHYDPQAVDACVALFREQGYAFSG